MKRLYMVAGPMGVGKSTVCRVMERQLTNCVYLDGDWCWHSDPFVVTPETKAMVMQNIRFVLNSFLRCTAYENIVFCWVMPEQDIMESLLAGLELADCAVVRAALVCSPEALCARLQADVDAGLRAADVIPRALAYLPRYERMRFPKLDVSVLTPMETAQRIINLKNKEENTMMQYPKSEKYQTPELLGKIMGPNPIKLTEELMQSNRTPAGAVVCDLGSGQGLTSVFLAREYGFEVYAADLWSEPEDNRKFFEAMGLSPARIHPVKADATALPFEKEFFDAVVSTDSYNYFGRDPKYLDEKLLPYVKKGGCIYIAIPGMKKDCHAALPPELLLSWTSEQLDYMHDVAYWRAMVAQSAAEVVSVEEMRSNEEVWADWLAQDNEYAVGDRKSMEAGGGKYLNFIAIVLRKKA